MIMKLKKQKKIRDKFYKRFESMFGPPSSKSPMTPHISSILLTMHLLKHLCNNF